MRLMTLTAAIACGLIAFTVTPSVSAKGARGGSSASFSSARTSTSYSAPRTSYRSTTTARPTPKTSTPVYRKKRDDDVECSTLRFSRYAADREVYRRYC